MTTTEFNNIIEMVNKRRSKGPFSFNQLSQKAQQRAITDYRHRAWVYDETDEGIAACLTGNDYRFNKNGVAL